MLIGFRVEAANGVTGARAASDSTEARARREPQAPNRLAADRRA